MDDKKIKEIKKQIEYIEEGIISAREHTRDIKEYANCVLADLNWTIVRINEINEYLAGK